MSSAVSPSAQPSSGSSLVIDLRRIVSVASQASTAVTVAVIVASPWFGGQSWAGSSTTVTTGGWVSATVTTTVSLSAAAPSETSSSTEVAPSEPARRRDRVRVVERDARGAPGERQRIAIGIGRTRTVELHARQRAAHSAVVSLPASATGGLLR
jgi:hypothetical protein